MDALSRVDVHVPGAEGGWIARALRDAGVSVRDTAPSAPEGSAIHRVRSTVDHSEILDSASGSDLEGPATLDQASPFDGETEDELLPALLILDTSVEDFEDKVTQLAVPTIAVGWDDLDAETIARLRLVAFFPRPVAIARLVRKVQTLLAGATLPSARPSSEPPPGPRAVKSGPSGPDDAEPIPSTSIRPSLRVVPPPTDTSSSEPPPADQAEPPMFDPQDAPDANDASVVLPASTPPPVEQSADDAGAEDAGAEDAGAEDAGAEDAGAEDAGAEDAGAEDAGAEDGPAEDPSADEHIADLEDAPGSATPPANDYVPREPTVALSASDAPEPVEPSVVEAAPSSVPPPRDAESDNSQEPRADATTGMSAQLSPHLVTLLRDADRRLFANEPALDLRLPGGDEDVDDLVPDDLIADVSMPLELPEPDPLEAFTFVGALDLLLESTGPGSSAGSEVSVHSVVEVDHTPHTIAEGVAARASRPPSSTVRSDLTREGMLPAGGVLRVLWQVHDDDRPADLRLDLPELGSVLFGLEGRRLVRLAGPVNQQVAERLRGLGRVTRTPENEDDAREFVETLVRRGQIDAFERDRLRREATESIVGAAVLASEAQFMIRSPSAEGDEVIGAPVSPPLVTIAAEVCRRKLDLSRALRWLDADADQKLVLATSFDERAAILRLEPEIYAAFDRCSDRAIGELLSGLPAVAGSAGLLFALASGDAIRFGAQRTTGDVSVSGLRDRVLRLHARCRDGSYFEILEVRRNASDREIVSAHRRLANELAGLDLDGLGLSELEGVVQDVLLALDEAFDVLSHAPWREAYAAGLDR